MLLTDQDHKMLFLMTFLFRNNNKWIKLNDLALHLNISKKTLHVYLDKLQRLFSDYGKFYSAGSMVKVNINPNFGLITAQRKFLNQSLIVKGLKKSFFNQQINKFDLSLEFDVSESSIYRSIKSFNGIIANICDLKFSYSNMCFEGEEEEIQKFYINFFIETNPDPTKWLFEDYFKEEYATKFASALIKFVKNKIYPSHYEYIKVAIAIATIRLKQGFKIPEDRYNKALINLLRPLSKDKIIRDIIRNEFPQCEENEISEKFFNIIGYFLSQDYFLFLLKSREEMMKRLQHEKHYDFFLKKLNFLCDKYNLKVENPLEFYYKLFTYYKFKVTNIDSVDFFVNHSEHFLTYIKFYDVGFYKDLEKIILEFIKTYPPKVKFEVKDLMYTIYTLWPNLMKQIMMSKVYSKALIISRYDYYFAQTIKSMIDLSMAYPLKIDVYDGYEIDFEKIKNSDYNVIIVDFQVNEDLGDKLVFSFEQIPTLHRIQELFKDLSYRNMDNMIEAFPEEFEAFSQILGTAKEYR